MFCGKIPSLITWIGVSTFQKSLPKQLRHLFSFAGPLLLHLGATKEVAYNTLVQPKLKCAASIWSLYSQLQIYQIEKVQRPAGPAGDGETRVASAKCFMSLNGHILRPVGISSPCFSFTIFIVEQYLLKTTSIWPLPTVRKLPGHHIVTRHTVMP